MPETRQKPKGSSSKENWGKLQNFQCDFFKSWITGHGNLDMENEIFCFNQKVTANSYALRKLPAINIPRFNPGQNSSANKFTILKISNAAFVPRSA